MKALVLGGGGARGSYQIGAWRALNECNQTFEIVTGTSVGAINAALYVQGDYELANQLWSQMTIDQVIKADGDTLERLVNKDFGSDDIIKIIEFFHQTIGQSGLDISPLRAMLKRYIDEEKLRQSPIKMGIVTFSLTDFKPLELSIDEIPEGQLHDYLIASASLPIFKLERQRGKLMLDGGFHDVLPVNLAARMGGTSFTVVDLKGMGVNRRDKNLKKQVITTDQNLGGTIEVSPQKMQRNIELGYYDGLRVLRGYRGRRYYVDSEPQNRALIARFSDIDSANCAYLKRLLNNVDIDDKRFVFEVLMPELADIFDLKQTADYTDIYLQLLEKIAESLQLERFKVWTFAEFEAAIAARYQPSNIVSADMPKFKKLLNLVNPQSDFEIKFYNTIYEKLVR